MAKSKVTFKPLRDWVLLPDPRKTKTDSGIYLTEETANKLITNVLTVIEVGPDTKVVKKGDTVMVDPNVAGLIIELDGVSHVLVSEFHCLGIL